MKKILALIAAASLAACVTTPSAETIDLAAQIAKQMLADQAAR